MAANSGEAADAVQATVERIRGLNERIIENARTAGEVYLDAYERSLEAVADYQRAVVSATPADWLKQTLEAQAAFARQFGELYAQTAREALRTH